MFDEETVQAFISVTSSDPQIARQLLESNEGDLEKAIESYFAIKDAEEELGRPVSQGVAVEEDDTQVSAEDGEDEEEEVVVPVRRSAATTRTSMADSFASGAYQESEQTGVPSHLEEGRLGQLFAPPSDLNFGSTLEQTISKGWEEKKWVLVDLQQGDNFACLLLNREVWSDATIKEFIQSSFVFWQRDVSSEDGQQFCSRYSVNRFPFVAVLDPRTGEKVVELDMTDIERVEKNYIVSTLCNFLERNVLDEWTAPRSSGTRPIRTDSDSRRSRRHSVDHTMDTSDTRNAEEGDAELAAAIAASLEDTDATSHVEDNTNGYSSNESNQVSYVARSDSENRLASQYASLTDPVLTEERELRMEQDAALAAAEAADRARLASLEEQHRMKQKENEEKQKKQVKEETEEATKHMRQRLKKSVLKEEPSANDPNATELLLRLPNDKRVVRRFLSSDTVQAVRDYVVYETGLSEDEFYLIIPYPRQVLADPEQTLGEMDIRNKAALIVETK
eukprot:jgi/Galph1/3939/GphlegSOOS_G2620.1